MVRLLNVAEQNANSVESALFQFPSVMIDDARLQPTTAFKAVSHSVKARTTDPFRRNL